MTITNTACRLLYGVLAFPDNSENILRRFTYRHKSLL
jgi:hypothetical protein